MSHPEHPPSAAGGSPVASSSTHPADTTGAGSVWYENGLSFRCTQCGNCCSGDPGYVWATPEEVRRIATFLGEPDGWLRGRHLRRVGMHYSLTERPDGDCIFLTRADGKAGCSIYPVRPTQCRTWPFWPSTTRTEQAWRHASQRCPGMKPAHARESASVSANTAVKTAEAVFYPVERIRLLLSAKSPTHPGQPWIDAPPSSTGPHDHAVPQAETLTADEPCPDRGGRSC